uniref:Scavenger receptor class B member 1 n=1 Tax=Timema cristinae TaxID=61476 RepID=A0A7R9CUP2_TIMCR|nr:unnamed protein product [Timema cristinae]
MSRRSVVSGGCDVVFRHVWVVKNGTSKDIVTIFTGKEDITWYGLIDKFNGHSHLQHWKTEKCNRLNGSDGRGVNGKSYGAQVGMHTTKLRLFNNRNFMPEGFEKEVDTAGGVKGYRFSPPTNVFGEVSKNPENDCFCPTGPPCAPNGLFNVSLCQYDSPVLISFPHFYLADPKLRDAVEGISPPEKEKHQLYIDVQPLCFTTVRSEPGTAGGSSTIDRKQLNNQGVEYGQQVNK